MTDTNPLPLPVEDYLAIQRLMFEFNLRFDAGDADGFADLFSADGVLVNASATHRAREERRRFVLDSAARPPHQHFTTNIVISRDSDDPSRATAVSCWVYIQDNNGSPQVRSGNYTDQFILTGDGWRFLRREATGVLR
jgi:hypothetical protein